MASSMEPTMAQAIVVLRHEGMRSTAREPVMFRRRVTTLVR